MAGLKQAAKAWLPMPQAPRGFPKTFLAPSKAHSRRRATPQRKTPQGTRLEQPRSALDVLKTSRSPKFLQSPSRQRLVLVLVAGSAWAARPGQAAQAAEDPAGSRRTGLVARPQRRAGRCGEHPGQHLRLLLRCGTIPESRRFRDCSTCTLRRHVAPSFHRLTSDTPSRAHDEPATAPPHRSVALSRRSLREPDVRSILVYGGTSV